MVNPELDCIFHLFVNDLSIQTEQHATQQPVLAHGALPFQRWSSLGEGSDGW